jgi:hypothetical protein
LGTGKEEGSEVENKNMKASIDTSPSSPSSPSSPLTVLVTPERPFHGEDDECYLDCSRRVRFSPDIQEIPIECHKEMPNDVRDSIWYSPIAQKHIEEHVRRTVCLMNAEREIPEEHADRFCTRGLEGRTRKALKRRTLDRDVVREAVFALQQANDEHSSKDPTMLAQLVSQATVGAQEEARKFAAWDERDAQEYLKDLLSDGQGAL